MSALTQPIIYAVGVTGSKVAGAKFAALAAGVVLFARKLNNVRKEAEAFAMQFRALPPEMRAVAMTMDSVGKGMVDTGQAIKSTQQLIQAQLKPTKELTSAIGRLATVEGLKFGETFDQINTRVQQLTDSIAKGQSRALKEYGINLRTSTSLHEMQANAVEQVIDRAEGLEVAITNVDQQMSILGNNIDTSIGLWWEYTTRMGESQGVLGWVNEGFTVLNEKIVESDGAIIDYTTSIDGIINSQRFFLASLTDNTEAMIAYAKMAKIARMEIQVLAQVESAWEQQEATRAQDVIAEDDAELESILNDFGGGADLTTMDVDQIDTTKFKKKTGGGGGKPRPTSQQFTGLNIISPLVVEVPIEPKYLILEPDVWDAEVTEPIRDRMAAAYAQQEIDYMIQQERMAQIYQVSQMETMLGIDQAYVDASHDLWNSSLRGRAMLLEGFFASGSQLMQAYNAESESSNKTLFGYAKAMAIGQATMKMYESAVSSYSSLAGIPYVGPVLGFIAAANAVAFGVAQIRQIAATKFNSSGSGSSAKSISGGGSSATATAGAGAWQGGGGGDSGGDTYYIVQGGLWTSDDAAESMRAKFIENESTGKWPHGLRESS